MHTPSGSDVLRWPAIGRFLRWRHARTTLQLFALLVTTVVVVHGLLGPQVAQRKILANQRKLDRVLANQARILANQKRILARRGK